MKRRFIAFFLAIVAGFAGGCKPSAASAPVEAVPTALSLPTKAQPKLPTIKLYIGTQEMTAEMALSMIQQETGMMFRTNMGDNEGMIFVMPQPQRASFWMKNCTLPLSAAYIDPAGTIVEIHDLQPQDTNSVVAAADNILYVLETPPGWFKRNGLSTGAVISTEKGSLSKTFFGRE